MALHASALRSLGYFWDTETFGMPRPRAAKLETPTARRKLPVRNKPYSIPISPGIHLGYRRNKGAGAWVAHSRRRWH